jgi:hypothetical protein
MFACENRLMVILFDVLTHQLMYFSLVFQVSLKDVSETNMIFNITAEEGAVGI